MRKYLPLVFIITLLLFLKSGYAKAEPLTASVYNLGNDYTLSFGKKAGGLRHTRNIVGLKKSSIASEDDAMVFALTRPNDNFGGDGASLGIIYTKPLQENIITTFSLTGGPTEDSFSTQDIAVSFHIHINFQ